MSQFVAGIIAASAAVVVTASVVIVRTLLAMRRDVIKFNTTIQAIARSQPYMLKGLRFQNAALREIGANGATEAADRCIDQAESVYDELLVAQACGETK